VLAKCADRIQEMIDSTASTRQPPAGGPGQTACRDSLLPELRRGGRDAFFRYFELFRAPVYVFVLALLGGEATAVAVTTEALTAAFRRVILDEAEADLETLTYRCAFDACVSREGARVASAPPAPPPLWAADRVPAHSWRKTADRAPADDGSESLRAALASLDLQRRAALLLHDLAELPAARVALVFGMTEQAAATLLFRAREEFNTAFESGSPRAGWGRCRQADQALAMAVGTGMADDESRRLQDHAAYCKPCRRALRSWGSVPVGLAVVFPEAPLPQPLAAPPVFESGASEVAPAAPAGMGVTLHRVRRTVRGRAFAYVVAAACLALAVGVLAHSQTLRPRILFESVGPAIRLVTGGSETPQPARVPDGRLESLRSSTQVAALIATSGTGIGQQARIMEPPVDQVVDDGGASSSESAENGVDDGGAKQPGAGGETTTASGGETAAAGGEDAAAAAGDGQAQVRGKDGRDEQDGRDDKDFRGGGRRDSSVRHGGDGDRSATKQGRDRSRHQGEAASGKRRGKND